MGEHVCPWWMGYVLLNPLRKWGQSPRKILGPHIRNGDTVLDVGSAMGFFSLEAARLTGAGGRVVCVDMQAKMIEKLRRRAEKANLQDRIEARVCTADSLKIDDLADSVDLALSIFVAHEVPDVDRYFREIAHSLKPGGRLLLSEPKFHVSCEEFDLTVESALAAGLEVVDRPKIRMSLTVLLAAKD